ncbi:MAG: hypothetical protein K6E42_08925 [Synergistes sp.]|nr:hypothetical protein [Synergistes sp.]
MTGKKYRYKGRVLFVRQYKAANGEAWATYFVDRMGIERAYTTTGMPLGQATEADAQAALDAFAAANGLKAVR